MEKHFVQTIVSSQSDSSIFGKGIALQGAFEKVHSINDKKCRIGRPVILFQNSFIYCNQNSVIY